MTSPLSSVDLFLQLSRSLLAILDRAFKGESNDERADKIPGCHRLHEHCLCMSSD